MKSVRLDRTLEDRLKRAAAARHESESDFMRRALEQRCDEVLGTSLYDRLKPFIGAVAGTGEPVAHRAHEVFGEVLTEEHERQVAHWRRRQSS